MKSYQVLPEIGLIETVFADDPPTISKPCFLINEEPEACNQMSDEDNGAKNKKRLP